MPHFPHTPEALLGRNDSKNPASTCKGITSSGRPCRRALASPKSSPTSRRQSRNSAVGGVVAIVQEDGEVQKADFYCWQHQDQAEQIVQEENTQQKKGRRVKRRSAELFPLQERSSIDTLVQRLGIDAAGEGRQKPSKNPKPPQRTETNDFATQQRPSQAPYAEKYNLGDTQKPPARPKKTGFWASLCCTAGGDDDYVEIVRHKKRTEQVQRPETTSTTPPNNRLSSTTRPASAAVPGRRPVTAPAAQLRPVSNAQTTSLLSLIPQYLSPQTTSALLAELTKPISPHDEEGYIYIFWLTPQSKTAPPESTARSLLAPPVCQRPEHHRRISDVMSEFSYDGDNDPESTARSTGGRSDIRKLKTIMLKIGRANNITRRMNEWQRQCGYALNLVRWYPYVPSSTPQTSPDRRASAPLYPDLSRPTTGSGEGVHKVPCVKRVERLIHLELAENQVKKQCAACGKEHREWFEVEVSQAGVKAVDEVVRRWVGWGERNG
ncbi:hypothetical protein LTR37_005902 [Vermiconidia calcicola]|uniref:Uncharacterized protein n=1 Tax=Vermiconidia calcicola TaxID=1690605 RepID=A0ACC3NHQ3_9PEZI|nr:hypothetical protein LTR37_005902 [Vermiconidia calcicola]